MTGWTALSLACLTVITPAQFVVASDEIGQLPLLVRRAEANFLARNWKSAADDFQRVVKLNPTNGLHWYRLGEAYLNSDQFASAIPPLRRAEELGGFQSSPPRWIHRGEAALLLAAAHAGLEDRDEAIHWTRQALQAGLRNLRQFHTERFRSLLADPEFRRLVWADLDEVDGLSRDERYRRDLKFAVHELKRIHYAPFRATPEAEIDVAVAELDHRIPQLDDDEIFVGMMRIIRLFGDAHTRMLRDDELAPVTFFDYPEGLFVVGATAEHADLVGARIIAIGGQPVEDAFLAAVELVAVENPMTARWQAAGVLQSLTVLRGLKLAPTSGPVVLEVEDARGETRSVKLAAATDDQPHAALQFTVPGCDAPLPLCFRNRALVMWHELLADGETMYCQLNGIGHGKKSFKRYFDELFATFEQGPARQLVLDVRWNNGGNTFLNPPLIDGIIRSAKLQLPGSLFLIIGRNTFSAALNTSDELERRTTAILVGEPTSSPPNFVGESVQVVLPASRWPISISDLSWQTSFPMDYRVWLTPTLYAPPTAAALRAHRDPAMEAIESFRQSAQR